MGYGRMVKVMPPSGGADTAVLYVVGVEDPADALGIVQNEVVIGSTVEGVGRVSHQLLGALSITPGQIKRL